ncbi:MAG: thiamine pyrophosphate-dependent enzyme [Candidatus Nanoarchaeia archaeon]
MKTEEIKKQLSTQEKMTWCPGCSNYNILEASKQAIASLIQEGKKQEDFAMVTGIGCHAKMFDYLNISGIYELHGRVIPACIGIKLGNPNLDVIGFAGDGDTYSEGMAHFIHAFRHNANITLLVHDNQSFSLTKGQPTPTTQIGYKDKSHPQGQEEKPLNPIKLALSLGATFIARCDPTNIEQTAEIIKKAIKHKGFSFVEVIQKCLIFNKDMNQLNKLMYKISDCHTIERAWKFANQWDYNTSITGKDKIPIGIIYQNQQSETLHTYSK